MGYPLYIYNLGAVVVHILGDFTLMAAIRASLCYTTRKQPSYIKESFRIYCGLESELTICSTFLHLVVQDRTSSWREASLLDT